MAAAGYGVAAVGRRLAMLAAVAQRQSGSRSFNRVSPRSRLLYLAPLTLGSGVVALVVLIRHPLMPVYIDILRKVVGY